MSNICLVEMRQTIVDLENQKKEIDKKIEALNVVLDIFEGHEQVKSVPKKKKAGRPKKIDYDAMA